MGKNQIKGIPGHVMNKVTAGAKEQIDIISKNYQVVATNMQEVRENQNQQMMALASMYAALEAIAEKLEVELPEPLINMGIEEE